jgi:hypothetical protein
MAEERVSQVAVETLATNPSGNARLSQMAIEVMATLIDPPRITQVAIEVLVDIASQVFASEQPMVFVTT